MKKITKPHDLTVKKVLRDLQVAKDFLQQYLPGKLQEKLDFDTLDQCPETYIDEALSESITDLLYSIQLQGKPCYIYALIEHLSSKGT